MSELRINNITDRAGSSGPIIAGVSTVTSTSHMVMPSGPTEMRGGRGRGVIAGGYNYPSGQLNIIQKIEIATTGNGADFGDTSVTASYRNACGNAVRGLIAGGYAPTSNNTIEFITIATLGNASDFGDLNNGVGGMTNMASPTRVVFAGGRTPSEINNMDYVQIPTTGNAVDFGDLLSTVSNAASVSNGHGGLG